MQWFKGWMGGWIEQKFVFKRVEHSQGSKKSGRKNVMCASALECCVRAVEVRRVPWPVCFSIDEACISMNCGKCSWIPQIITKIMMYRLRTDSHPRDETDNSNWRPKEFRFNHWLLPWCTQFSILLQFISWKDSTENATHRTRTHTHTHISSIHPSINVQRSATALDEEGRKEGMWIVEARNDRKIIYYCENKSDQ